VCERWHVGTLEGGVGGLCMVREGADESRAEGPESLVALSALAFCCVDGKVAIGIGHRGVGRRSS
jgi:hypothetical protein